MKKVFFICLSAFISYSAIGQIRAADSLKRALSTAKTDSARLKALSGLVGIYYETETDSALFYSQIILQTAVKINSRYHQAEAFMDIGYGLFKYGNFPMALSNLFKGLSIAETVKDTSLIGLINSDIGNVYQAEGDYASAITMSLKEKNLLTRAHKIDKSLLGDPYMNLAVDYEHTIKPDSALYYFQQAYLVMLHSGTKIYLPSVFMGLGDVNLNMGYKALALNYYNLAVKEALKPYIPTTLCAAYSTLANFYLQQNKIDSSLYYAQKAFGIAKAGHYLQSVLAESVILTQLYKSTGRRDSVLKYLEITLAVKDSLFGVQKMQQFDGLRFEEQLQTQQARQMQLKEAEQRRLNIQYAAIAFGIIFFVIVFLLLSRSIIVSTRLIEIAGVIGLLIIFEFIYLVLHPYLSTLTNDSPLLMLLILVLIAAVIVPVHHQLEQWIKHKLVEKNKAIRLAAAKRTIEKLEAGNEEV